MKTIAKFLFTISLAASSINVAAPLAHGHSFPEQESPAAGESLATPPSQVAITYDAPIESLFDSLRVLDSAGQDKAAGAPRVSDDGRKLTVSLSPLPPGQYTVRWRVVCVDTHHTEGSYTFTVK